MDPDVPLIVPEVNPNDLKNHKKKNIVANANCSVIPLVVALKPLHDLSLIHISEPTRRYAISYDVL